MQILELESLPIEQVTDLHAFERRLGDWIAGIAYPVRLIIASRPFRMDRPILQLHEQLQLAQQWYQLARRLLPAIMGLLPAEELGDEDDAPDASPPAADAAGAVWDDAPPEVAAPPHPAGVVADLPVALRDALALICGSELAHVAATPEAATLDEWLLIGAALEQLIWPVPYLKELRRFYRTLATRHVRSASYHLVTFEPKHVQAEAIIASLRYATTREVRLVERLPTMIDGPLRVDEAAARLVPTRSGDRYVSVLRAYDTAGEVDATLLHPLLDLPFDLTIAVDIKTLSPSEALRQAEWVYSAARAALRDGQVIDTRSEQRLHDAEAVMRSVRTQTLHEVQVAMLVTAESAEELEVRKATVRDRLGSTMKFEAVRGSQAELLKLFSTLPPGAIDAAWARSSQLSHGVGCLLGVLGYYRPSHTGGLFWGIDALRHAPIFFNLFEGAAGDEDQAGHLLVLGKSGSGKTYLLNCLSLRAATQLGYRVVWVDAFDNGARLQRAAGAGARLHRLQLGQTINLLDTVYDPTDGPGWIASQVQHVIGQLALLLGETGLNAAGDRRLQPRCFTRAEQGFLERALKACYLTMERHGGPAPILDDLIDALEVIAETEAIRMARDLRAMIYGSTTRRDQLTVIGASFNGPTTIDWRMQEDLVCFDLSAILRDNPDMLAFYYAQVVGALYRYMRDPQRDRSRKTLVIIDEFGIAAQVEAVAQMAATMTKVARKYGIGMVIVDQNPLTFLDSLPGKIIIENTRVKLMFQLDAIPAQRMAAALPDLTPFHVELIVGAERGYAVGVFQHNVSYLWVESTRREQRMLHGS